MLQKATRFNFAKSLILILTLILFIPIVAHTGNNLPLPEKESRQNFEIEAYWVGEVQWMTGVNNGFAAFNGSIDNGDEFIVSNIEFGQFVPILLKFETDQSKWTNCQVVRRETYYKADGIGTFPGSAWDISSPSNPRRLNICFVEFDADGDSIPAPNNQWDPDTTVHAKYEFVFIMNSPYDPSATSYEGREFVTDPQDILYAWWPRVEQGHELLEYLPAALEIRPFMYAFATQRGTRVEIVWDNPGPQPDHFGIFWTNSFYDDSLIAVVPGNQLSYVHKGVIFEDTNRYVVKSFDELGDESTSSNQTTAEIMPGSPAIAISPTPNSNTVETNSNITIDFVVEMDPLSFDDADISIYGQLSGPMSGVIGFENGNTRLRFVPDTEFIAGEIVTVALSKNVKMQNGNSAQNGYTEKFRIKVQPGTFLLNKIAEYPTVLPGESDIWSNSLNASDFNNDGWSDLAVFCGESDDVRIFLNDGTGRLDSNFSAFSFTVGGHPLVNATADFRMNGTIDIATGAFLGNSVKILEGDGTGSFGNPTTYQTGQYVQGISWLDVDSDGDKDIMAGIIYEGSNGVSVLLNNGDGTFVPASPGLFNIEGTTSESADANGDGLIDLFTGSLGGAIFIYFGTGTAWLHEYNVTIGAGYVVDIAVGDLNSDLINDVVCVTGHQHTARVFLADGNGNLIQTAPYFVGSYTNTVDLGDIDGDGDLDFVTSSSGSGEIKLFENDGNGIFSLRTTLSVPGARHAILHDRDNDGDLDLTGVSQHDDYIVLYENSCCSGIRGDYNHDGTPADLLDLNFLVNYIFRSSGQPGPCATTIDINGDGKPLPNIIDLNYLVNYVFRDGPPPLPC